MALHLGVQSIHSGECEMALVGGVNLLLSPIPFILLCRNRMLAPDGRCKTFDASADGYVRSEGVAFVVLKKLSSALRDNNRILAKVCGSAVNSDGASSSLVTPSSVAQQSLIEKALSDACLTFNDISVIEAHGSGNYKAPNVLKMCILMP